MNAQPDFWRTVEQRWQRSAPWVDWCRWAGPHAELFTPIISPTPRDTPSTYPCPDCGRRLEVVEREGGFAALPIDCAHDTQGVIGLTLDDVQPRCINRTAFVNRLRTALKLAYSFTQQPNDGPIQLGTVNHAGRAAPCFLFVPHDEVELHSVAHQLAQAYPTLVVLCITSPLRLTPAIHTLSTSRRLVLLVLSDVVLANAAGDFTLRDPDADPLAVARTLLADPMTSTAETADHILTQEQAIALVNAAAQLDAQSPRMKRPTHLDFLEGFARGASPAAIARKFKVHAATISLRKQALSRSTNLSLDVLMVQDDRLYSLVQAARLRRN